jgi:hypothetical protein
MYMYIRNIDSSNSYDNDAFVIVYFISILFLLYRSIYLSQKFDDILQWSGIRRTVIKESINDCCISKYKSIYHTGMPMTWL